MMMRTGALLGMALIAAGLCAGQQQKPAGKKDEKESQAQTERVMPFGSTVRAQDPQKGKAGQQRDRKVEPPPNLQAFDEGDQVRFESRLPFGVSQYRKKKSELNEVERAALERSRKKPAGQ